MRTTCWAGVIVGLVVVGVADGDVARAEEPDGPSVTGPAPAPDRVVVAAGGLVGVGGSRYTTLFPDPGAAWQIAVRGGVATWALGSRLGLAPELAISHGVRVGDRAAWMGLAGVRLAGRPDLRSPHVAFLVARAGWGGAAPGVVDLGVGAELRWPGSRWRVELELGALVTRVTTPVGDVGDVMSTRATYGSGHLGVAVGRGF